MHLKIYSVLASLLFLWMLAACEATGLESHLAYQKELSDDIRDFETERNQIEQSITIIFKSVVSRLSYEKPFFSSIAREWEDHLDKFQTYHEAFQKAYQELDSSAIRYLNHLDSLSLTIKDKNLREEEVKTNHLFRAKWLKLKKVADKEVETIAKLLEQTKDFKQMLVTASLRQKPGKTIVVAKKLQQRFLKSFKQLKNFVKLSNSHITTDGLDSEKASESKPPEIN